MKQSKKWIVGIIVIIAVVAIGYVVSIGPKKGSVSTEPIKIGFIGPLTGENAAIGEGIKNAISLAADKEGVKIIYEDDQFRTDLGVTAYHKLNDIDQVDALINTTPGVIDAITPLLVNNPLIVVQIAEPTSSEDDSIFQIMPSGVTLYQELGKVAKDMYDSLAFVFQQGATFEKAKDAFQETYQDSEHHFQEYQLDESKDYKTIVAKIKNSEAEAYTLIATPSVGVQFIRQMIEGSAGKKMLCNADVEVTIAEYLKVLPNNVFDGCISVMFADRMSIDFKNEYKNTFKSDPGFATDYGYDAVRVISQTYDTSTTTWITNLKRFMGNGVSGKIQFDNNGVRIPEMETHMFIDGVFKPVSL